MAWRKGIEFVSASPTRFANSVLGKFGSYWSPIPNAVHKGSEYGGSWRDVVSILSYVPVLILGLWGVVLSFKNWRRLMPIYLYFVAFSAPVLRLPADDAIQIAARFPFGALCCIATRPVVGALATAGTALVWPSGIEDRKPRGHCFDRNLLYLLAKGGMLSGR